MSRQFIAVVFKDGGRPYTYHSDGEQRLEIDNIVRVSVRGGHEQRATIVGFPDEPSFETKPIIGLAEADADLFTKEQ